jgi:hypothetical protein
MADYAIANPPIDPMENSQHLGDDRKHQGSQLSTNPMPDLEYLTDSTGILTAVVIPIALWRQLLPYEDASQEAIGEALEDYCLNRAIDEGKQTPLLTRAEALAYLEE